MSIENHLFLGLPDIKPRVWVDLSSYTSKRAGLAMHSPGRKTLKWALKVLGWFAWLPIEKILRGPLKRFDELEGHNVIKKVVVEPIEYLVLYMGNDLPKTKLTILVRIRDERKGMRDEIVKLGRTLAAREAIRNEVEILKKLESTQLRNQVPAMQTDVENDGIWTWSVQSVLPKGKSPAKMRREHYDFLDALKKIGISHGDFAPWNCSIVGGKLYVWDWEDAGDWEEGKDEAWFNGQVKKLLGINS